MKLLKPGAAYYGLFITSNPNTGAAVNADSLPTVTATRNGADDGAFVLTAANINVGRYKITGTVPANYAAGDQVQVSVAAAVAGVAGKGVVDEFIVVPANTYKLVDGTANLNVAADVATWLGAAPAALANQRVVVALDASCATGIFESNVARIGGRDVAGGGQAATNDGWWETWGSIPFFGAITQPNSIYVASQDKTWIVWLDASLAIRIKHYNHATKAWSTPRIVSDNLGWSESHAVPSVAILSSGHLCVYFGMNQNGQKMKKSADPYDETSWGPLQQAGTYEIYPSPWLASNGKIYEFCHTQGPVKPTLLYRTYDGATRSSPVIAADEWGIYAIVRFDAARSVFHVFMSVENTDYGVHTPFRDDLYYMKGAIQGDGSINWTKRDGTAITTPATRTTMDMLFAHQGTSNPAVGAVSLDSAGRPMLVWNVAGSFRCIRDTGAAWAAATTICSPPYAYSAYNQEMFRSVVLRRISDTRVIAYVVYDDGTTTMRSGKLYEYETTDAGATWRYLRRLHDSNNVCQLASVYNPSPDKTLELLWSGGTDGKNAIYGWGGDPVTPEDVQTVKGVDADAAILSEQEVRDAMKLAPSAGVPEAGSVDKHLDDIAAGMGVGPGGAATTFNVQVGGVPVEGVECWISTSIDGTHVIAGPLVTDVLGTVTFMLEDNSGPFFLWRQRGGYNLPNPTTIVWDAATSAYKLSQ